MGKNVADDPERELTRLSEHDLHFLDANLLIGYSVEWDQMNSPATYYYQSFACNYLTSERVLDEARGVVENCRRMALRVVEHVGNEFKAGREYEIIDDIHKFVDREFDDLKSPVKNYIEERETKFRQLAKTQSEKIQREARKTVRGDFKLPLGFFTKLGQSGGPVQVWEQAPSDPKNVYPDKHADLSEAMSNPYDRNILLDAYDYVLENQSEDVLVATTDRCDFVDDRLEIENILIFIEISDVLGLWRAEVSSKAT